MDAVEADLRRASVWGLFGIAGLLAILGVSPGATLFLLFVACIAAAADRVVTLEVRRVARLRPERPAVPPTRAGHAHVPRVNDVDPAAFAPAIPTPEALRLWTDEAVCQAWRTSYLRVRHLVDDPQRCVGLAAVALERARYLDELERRNPSGFSAWLTAGARAPSDPAPYLARPSLPRRREPEL